MAKINDINTVQKAVVLWAPPEEEGARRQRTFPAGARKAGQIHNPVARGLARGVASSRIEG